MTRATLFVLIDGLGWELLQQADFLADLAPHRYRLRTVLGTSSATIPTILTGAAPADHGHWMPFAYAPTHSPFHSLAFLRHLPRRLTSSDGFRKHLAGLLAHHFGWTGQLDLGNIPAEALPLLDFVATRDPCQPGGVSPCATAIDRLHQERIPCFVSDGRNSDRQSFDDAAAALADGSARFLLLHVREPDAVLHRDGPASDAARAAIAQCEQAVRSLYDAATSHNDLVRLYIGSDRGVTQVTHTLDIQSKVRAAGLTFGSDYFAFYDPTMARFWFSGADVRHHAMASIGDVDCGRWLADGQLRLEGIFFPDHRFGQAIFLLDPGWTIVPNYHSATATSGMHGYHPDHPDSWGAFAANVILGIPPTLIGDLSALITEGARWAMG